MGNDVRTIFPINLQRYADIAAKTRNDISDALGVSSATVCDWFNGKKYPRPEKMQKLADFLNVSIADLQSEPPPLATVDIKDIIYTRRKELGYSLEHLAGLVGVSKQTVQKWECGRISNMKRSNIAALSIALQVPIEILMGWQNEQSTVSNPFPAPQITEDYVEFPVIGDMAAGFEHVAAENWEGEKISIPAQYLRGRPASDYIVLNVLGDSMYPFYLEGDKVLILRTPTLERSGQIGLVRYDGEMATLKKVEYVDGEDWVKLIPLNPMYQPREITGADLEQCSVIGVPKLIIRELE